MPQLYMVFNTEADALTASAEISATMGLGAPGMTTQVWNDVCQRATDGKSVILWPGDNVWLRDLSVAFTIENYDAAWFPMPVE